MDGTKYRLVGGPGFDGDSTAVVDPPAQKYRLVGGPGFGVEATRESRLDQQRIDDVRFTFSDLTENPEFAQLPESEQQNLLELQQSAREGVVERVEREDDVAAAMSSFRLNDDGFSVSIDPEVYKTLTKEQKEIANRRLQHYNDNIESRARIESYKEDVQGGLGSRAAKSAAWGVADTLQLNWAAMTGGNEDIERVGRSMNEIQQAFAETSPGWVDRAVTSASSSIAQALYFSPLGGTPGVIASFVQDSLAQNYADAKDANFTESEAQKYAIGQAALEGGIAAAFASVGLGGLESMASWAGKGAAREFTRRMAKQWLAEVAEEEITSFSQAALSKLAGVDPQALDNPWQLATDVAVATTLAMGAGAVGARGSQAAADFITNPTRRNALRAKLARIVKGENGEETVESIVPTAKDRRRVADLAKEITAAKNETEQSQQDGTTEVAAETSPTPEATPPQAVSSLSTSQQNLLRREYILDQTDPRYESAKEKYIGPGGRARVVEQVTLSEALPEGATVYHETDLSGAKSVLPRLNSKNGSTDLWVSDNPDLAQGQGGTGYLIEIDPGRVNGSRRSSKPGAAIAQGSEFRLDAALRDSVLSVTAPNQRGVNALRKIRGMEAKFDFDNAQPTERGIRIPRKQAPASQTVDVAASRATEAAQEPPVPAGKVRFYHGGAPYEGGPRWVTQDRTYARDYRTGGILHYVDIDESSPLLKKAFDDTGADQTAPYVAFEAPEEIASQLRPISGDLTAAASRATEAAQEYQDQPLPEGAVGITPNAMIPAKEVDDTIQGVQTDLKSTDPAVEQQWQASKAKFNRSGPLARALRGAVEAGKSIVHKYPRLAGERFAAVRDVLRVAESIGDYAHDTAANALRGITAGMGPKKYDIFSRVLILRDLKKDVARGLYDGKPLPFGMSPATLDADLAKFETLAAQNPDIAAAIARRQEFMTALRDELVERNILPESVKEFDDYFHHQVLEYMRGSRFSTSGIGSRKLPAGKKSFQFARKGSDKAYNTEYLDAEFAVISQALMKIEFQEALNKLQRLSDVKPQLQQVHGDEWRSNIPDGYTLWQPVRGNLFYPTFSISEKAMTDYLLGNKILTEEDFNKVWAQGARRSEWVIPEELAATLDNFSPRADTGVEAFLGAGQGLWKRWTLFAPYRFLKYSFNNLTGDADGVMAYDPRIFKYAPKAFRDLKAFHLKGKRTPELIDATRNRVIGSGWRMELADEGHSLTYNSLFKDVTGNRSGLSQWYWDRVQKLNALREDTLRLAAYRYFKDQMSAGKTDMYGASSSVDVAQVRQELGDDAAAAKLASELLGDYGNISEGGDWLRRHMVPFYAWQEINAKRYLNLFKNIEAEGGSVRNAKLRSAATKLGVRGTGLALRLSLYYGMVNAWNHFVHGDLEDQLGEEEKRQLHIILGQRDDGTIISLRAQGAFSDFLAWVGLQDAPHDMSDMLQGKKSAGDMGREALSSFANKAVQGVDPIKKTALEAATGQSLFPDLFNPRPVRDSVEHLATLALPRNWYRSLAGTPNKMGNPLEQPGVFFSSALSDLLLYTTDPGEAAYYGIRAKAADYNRDVLGKDNSGFSPSSRTNALYYYKQAVRYGDDELAQQWLGKYLAMGGTIKGMQQSVKNSDPLNFVNKKYRAQFLASLSPEEVEAFNRARAWWQRVYAPTAPTE